MVNACSRVTLLPPSIALWQTWHEHACVDATHYFPASVSSAVPTGFAPVMPLCGERV